MPKLFEVEADDIKLLNDVQLTKLLKLLLHLEAQSHGIPERNIEVGLKINVPDGGEDGSIRWNGGSDSTNYLPFRYVQFQVKATEMKPQKCVDELISGGKVKNKIDEALRDGAAYILFCNRIWNDKQKRERINKIKTKLKELDYAPNVIIKMYDASTIEEWVNGYLSAIVSVHNWVGRPLISGLNTWENLSQYERFSQYQFFPDEKREEYIVRLKELLSQPRKCARITGLSGLGKTRLAFEVFRDIEELDNLGKRMVYLDASSVKNTPVIISDWIFQKIEGIVVVDNCDRFITEKIREEIKRNDSRLSLLTIDNDLFEIGEIDLYIQLERMTDEIIEKMLIFHYGDKIPDLNRIVQFAQGFPQMAVLLAKARLNKDPKMGRLNDDGLAQKLLWGNGVENEKDEEILNSCAIFDTFGLEDTVSHEYIFIANNIANIDSEVFYKCVKKFEERGLIDRRGRYAKLVPKPLAIRLASTWWKRTPLDKQLALIQILPNTLVESFCAQITCLDFLPEVKELTYNICGEQSPFGQAKVILSVRGSRLFRAFVEVNPEITSHTLYKIMISLSKSDILDIQGETRRNLVYALERLCFHKIYFEESAHSLFLLALHENESWANNATGIFKQLFRVHLSGTEAPPEMRIKLLDCLLNRYEKDSKIIIIETLGDLLDHYGFGRIIGAENQGSGVPLQEWKPKVWGEIFAYWNQVIARLTDLTLVNDEYAPLAKSNIAKNMRGLVRKGQVKLLDETIMKITTAQGTFWPEALENLGLSLRYDWDSLPKEGRDKLSEWLDFLAPSELPDRLFFYVSKSPFDMSEVNGEMTDHSLLKTEGLAKELSLNIESLIPYLKNLLTGEQRYAFAFGEFLVKEKCEWDKLFQNVVDIIADIKNPNITFVKGVLRGIYNCDPDEWENKIIELSETESLTQYYPSFIHTGNISLKHLKYLLHLLRNNRTNIEQLEILTFGKSLSHLNTESVCDFVIELSSISGKGAWLALKLLELYCSNDQDLWQECKDSFEKILLVIPLDQNQMIRNYDMFYWRDAVKKILESNNGNFAIKISENITRIKTLDLAYIDLQQNILPITSILFSLYGEYAWPIFSNEIKTSDKIRSFWLKNILIEGIAFDSQKGNSSLSNISDDLFKDWCEKDPEFAPKFLASVIEIITNVNGEFCFTNKAMILIDNYGNDQNVLSAISANMGTFGWSGSLVPYLEIQLKMFKELSNHPKENIQKWTKNHIISLENQIKRETRSDEEEEWGIGF